MERTLARTLLALLLALGAVACESPPEDRCRTSSGAGSVDFDCSDGSGWEEDALEEADEGMERRGPGGRP